MLSSLFKAERRKSELGGAEGYVDRVTYGHALGQWRPGGGGAAGDWAGLSVGLEQGDEFGVVQQGGGGGGEVSGGDVGDKVSEE